MAATHKPLLGPCDSATEEWRNIPGYPGYQASSLGRVRSLDKKVRCRGGGFRLRPGRVLAPVTHHTGYTLYTLHIGNRQKSAFGHRLVMDAFVGPLPDGYVTCHKDGSRQNNRLCNLRYGTKASNEQDKRGHGTYQKEEQNPRAVFSLEKVVTIRQLRAAGASVKHLAQQFNNRPGHISKICTGFLWPDAPGPLTRRISKNA